MRDDLRELRHDVASCVSGAGQAGVNAIRHGAEVAQESTRHAIERAGEAKDLVRDRASDHPLATALIGFGAGALVMGILTWRRS